MKILTPAAALALMLAMASPVLADQAPVCQSTSRPTANSVPPQCALDETRQKHPDWYRDGGYCDTGSTLPDIGVVQDEDCLKQV